MPITVDALRNLAENQSVMLNAQTQGLERSSLSLRFRSAFGTRGAANTNSQTLAAIRQAVVTDPRFSCVQQRAGELFDRLNASKLVRTNAIRGILADLDAARELHAVNLRASALALLASPEGGLAAAGRERPELLSRMVNRLLASYGGEAGGDLCDLTAQGIAASVRDLFAAVEEAAGGDAAVADWAVCSFDERPAAFATPGAVRREIAAYRAAAARLDAAAARLGDRTFADLPAGDGLREARAVGSALLKALAPVADAMAAADAPQNIAVFGAPEKARAFIARSVCAALDGDVRRALFDALTSEGGLQLARFLKAAGDDPRCKALFDGARALADALRAQADGGVPAFSEAVDAKILDSTRLPAEAFALAPLTSLFMGHPSPEIARIRDVVLARPEARDGEAAFAERMRASVEGRLRDVYVNELAKMGDNPNGRVAVFDKDIVRSLNVTLPNGERLAHSVEESKNQIARYVAHDPRATFAALAPNLKARAERIVALCSQETEKTISYSISDMCRDERGFTPFMIMEEMGQDRDSAFTIHENPDGSLGFVYEARVPVSRVVDSSGTPLPCGPGTTQRALLAFSVAADGALAVQTAALGFNMTPEIEQEALDVQEFGRIVDRLGFTEAETERLVALMEREQARGAGLAGFNHALQDPASPLRRLLNYPALQRDPATFARARDLLARFDAVYAQLAAADARVYPPTSKWFLERLVFDDLALKLESGQNLPTPDAFARALAADRNPFVGFMKEAKRHAGVAQTVAALPAQDREGVVRALTMTGGSTGPSVLNRLVARREDLRALVARGRLTPENVFRTCWGDPIPDDLRAAMNVRGEAARRRALSDAFEYFDSNRLEGVGVTPAHANFLGCLTMMWKYGVDAREALDIVEGRVPEPARALNPFEPMSVTSIQAAQDPAKAEEQLAMDIPRMRDGFTDVATNERRLGDAPSTFSFLLPDGTALDLDSSANGLEAADAQKRDDGHPYSVSQQIRDAATRLCGEAHPMQIANVILGLAQGCVAPLRTQAAAHGVRATEHSQAAFRVEAVRDAHGQPTGDVAVHVTNLPGCPLVFDWTVTVHPDGSQDLSPVTMHRAADA